LFFHLLNDQIIELFDFESRARPSLRAVARISLRLSTSFDLMPTLIPTVDLVQSPLANSMSPELNRLTAVGLVQFVGSTDAVDELMDRKRRHFRGTSIHSRWLSAEAIAQIQPFESALQRRRLNTTQSMKDAWQLAASEAPSAFAPWTSYPATLIRQVTSARMGRQRRGIERELVALPERLEDHAFLNSVIEELGLVRARAWTNDDARSLELALACLWLRSHLDEYGPFYVGTAPTLGWVDCGLRFSGEFQPVRLDEWAEVLRAAGLLELTVRAPEDELAAFAWSSEFRLLQAELLSSLYRVRTQTAQAEDALAARRIARVRLGRPARSDRLMDRVRRVLGQTGPDATGRRRGSLTPVAMARAKPVIFIGHGRSLLWRELKDFLQDDLGFEWREFNSSPAAGLTAKERLEDLLDECTFALLVLTAEDEHADGSHVARQNVVHEVGLFQGRLGFESAIVLREEGCAEFSNLAGVQEIRFPASKISAAFYEVGRLLRDRLS
jgi:predicted nucleotide-binding protein